MQILCAILNFWYGVFGELGFYGGDLGWEFENIMNAILNTFHCPL